MLQIKARDRAKEGAPSAIMHKSIPGRGLRCGKKVGLRRITRKVVLMGGRQSDSIGVRNDRLTVRVAVTVVLVVRGQEVLLLLKAAVVLPVLPVVRVSPLNPDLGIEREKPGI